MGITASFTSPEGRVFLVQESFFTTFGGNYLGSADGLRHSLNITFNTPVRAISIVFALNGDDSTVLQVEAFTGGLDGTAVGSMLGMGVVSDRSGFPEGSVSLMGPLDSLRLTSTAADFAIGRLDVTAVPEQTSAIFVAAPLLLITLPRHLRITFSFGRRKV
jgi:hypothetical protein